RPADEVAADYASESWLGLMLKGTHMAVLEQPFSQLQVLLGVRLGLVVVEIRDASAASRRELQQVIRLKAVLLLSGDIRKMPLIVNQPLRLACIHSLLHHASQLVNLRLSIRVEPELEEVVPLSSGDNHSYVLEGLQ